MKLYLTTHDAYPWTREENICFRGYFLIEDQYYSGSSALEFLKKALAKHELSTVLCKMNGSYSLIIDQERAVFFAVDRLRGLPLFYAVSCKELYVGDDAQAIVEALPSVSVNQSAVEAFCTTKLYTLGADTMIQELRQAQAGCCCWFEKETAQVEEKPYFTMEPGELVQDIAALTQQFQQAYDQVGAHLVKALRGRTAVVPLSGGADSRMVVSMLKAHGYEKVLCFTYGNPRHNEVKISKEVAAHFEYPWIFVPYDRTTWAKIRKSGETEQYFREACSYVSTPHFLDYAAVKALCESGKLPPDSVFVPGHSGDLIAGSHISSKYIQNTMDREGFLEEIAEHFFVDKPTPALARYLEQRFPAKKNPTMESLEAQSTWFNTQERQAKYIVNSVRVYEHFGFEWLVPLWDTVLFDFWSRVPISWKYGRKLYFTVVHGGHLPSTNDQTSYRRFSNCIRTMPVLCTLSRRITRILRYWSSDMYLERMFTPKKYLLACLKESETLRPSFLLSEDCVRWVKESVAKKNSDG